MTEYELMGTVFSKITKVKTDGKFYEKVESILGELAPIKISIGNTASKLSIPIPSSPAIRIRMGFQGHTLQIVAYIHEYNGYRNTGYYTEMTLRNWYSVWKNEIEIEDLIKVSTTGDLIVPPEETYGPAIIMDGGDHMSVELPSAWSVQPLLKPNTYWWVRRRNIVREAGWDDKFRLELDLERSWQWSTSGRPRPAWDIDDMACFKDGETGYKKATTEYKVV